MPMPSTPFILIAFAIVFFGLALRSYRRDGGKSNPARKTWVRIGIIFTAVAIALYVLPRLR